MIEKGEMAMGHVAREPEGRYPTPTSDRLVHAVEKIWVDEGDLALTVRRLLKEAKATSRDLYQSFGRRENLMEHVANELAVHIATWSPLVSRAEYLAAALERPAAWRALLLGHGPDGRSARRHQFLVLRADIGTAVGGDIELAKLDGIIAASFAGRLDPTQLTRAVRDPRESQHQQVAR